MCFGLPTPIIKWSFEPDIEQELAACILVFDNMGTPLSTWVTEHKLDAEATKCLCFQVIWILSCLHRNSILHGDLHKQNILIREIPSCISIHFVIKLTPSQARLVYEYENTRWEFTTSFVASVIDFGHSSCLQPKQAHYKNSVSLEELQVWLAVLGRCCADFLPSSWRLRLIHAENYQQTFDVLNSTFFVDHRSQTEHGDFHKMKAEIIQI
jgi:serine/threonine protein kinase